METPAFFLGLFRRSALRGQLFGANFTWRNAPLPNASRHEA